MRNSCVVYDRNDSSFNSIKPGVIDWRTVFSDVDIFHCSGITCAVSQSAADANFRGGAHSQRDGAHHLFVISITVKSVEIWCRCPRGVVSIDAIQRFRFRRPGEYDAATGLPRVPFDPTTSDAVVDEAAYMEYFAKVQAMFPHCHQFLMAVRNQMTSTHHTITGCSIRRGNSTQRASMMFR